MKRPISLDRHRRLGFVLVAVLVSMAVVTVVGAGLVKHLVAHHRQTLLIERQQQSFWLAESALGRTIDKLKDEPAYGGETWRLSPETLGGKHAGAVVIDVSTPDDSPNARRIRVEARYPDDNPHQAYCLRELLVKLPESGREEP